MGDSAGLGYDYELYPEKTPLHKLVLMFAFRILFMFSKAFSIIQSGDQYLINKKKFSKSK